jgi:predicted transcriptional regulator
MARALAKAGFEDVFVLDAESASEVLTEKRRELLRQLRTTDVRSVYSLAESLGRDRTAVSRDLGLLAEHDLVTLEREGTRKIPRLKHETVVVEPVL